MCRIILNIQDLLLIFGGARSRVEDFEACVRDMSFHDHVAVEIATPGVHSISYCEYHMPQSNTHDIIL